MAEWIRKQDPYICVYKRPTSDLKAQTDKSKGVEKDISCNTVAEWFITEMYCSQSWRLGI